MTKTKSIYETPLVRVEAVSTECGFATSETLYSAKGGGCYDLDRDWNDNGEL